MDTTSEEADYGRRYDQLKAHRQLRANEMRTARHYSQTESCEGDPGWENAVRSVEDFQSGDTE